MTQRQLSAYCVGETTDSEAETIALHVSTCATCETALEKLQHDLTEGSALLRMLREGSCEKPFESEPERNEALIRARRVWSRLRDVMPLVDDDPEIISKTPAKLRDYELIRPLGHGGMGTVYLARHNRLDKCVAIKLIRPEHEMDPERADLFDREMKAAGRMEHANIVRALDAGETEGVRYLVMEFVEGQTAAEHIAQHGTMSVATASMVVQQVAAGLRHIHQLGFIHRDIKPSNLMLCSESGSGTGGTTQGSENLPAVRTKILDFGIARLSEQTDSGLTTNDQVIGSFDYIAPEQTRNAPSVDARADIYSLGCTFYFLLTGHRPFAGSSVADKLVAHQLDEPRPINDFRDDIPPDLVRVVNRMMSKSPADRFQSAAEVEAALAEWSTPSIPQPTGLNGKSNEHGSLPVKSPTILLAILLSLVAMSSVALVKGTPGAKLARRDAGTIPSIISSEAASVSADLRIARWVRSLGGSIQARHHGTTAWMGVSDFLDQDVQVVGINLRGTAITTADLRNLSGLQHLERIYVGVLDDREHESHLGEFDRGTIQALVDAELLTLTHLCLYGVPIDDAGLRSVQSLQSIRQLTIDRGTFTDEGLRCLGELPELRHLSLPHARINGSGLQHLEHSDLRLLVLLEVPLADKYFKAMPLWPNLEVLRIDGCPLSDEAIHSIARYKGIVDLGANLTPNATAEAWKVLDQLPQLRQLRLIGNTDCVNEEVVSMIAHLDQVQDLDLTNCALHDGSIESLRQTSSLKRLAIARNPKVSLAAVETLRDALPGCDLVSDYGDMAGNNR